VLAQLLRSNSLKPHRFQRNSAIGPFVVEHVCRERALVVELRNAARAPRAEETREANRRALLLELGFRLLLVSRSELLGRPQQVLAQVRAALC
jgi:very-short-patch-repair endonuclease